MRRINHQAPAREQAQKEYAPPPPVDSPHSRLKEQRYLADVMDALEADRLSEEERAHLKQILMRCFREVAVRGV